MSRFYLLLSLLLFFCQPIFSQNLVPNPSFEEVDWEPNSLCDSFRDFQRAIKKWNTANEASTDLITRKFKSKKVIRVEAHTGKNSVGIVTQGDFWSEYIQVKTIDTLRANTKYYVEFWIVPADKYASSKITDFELKDNFGIHFSDNKFFERSKIAINKKPQFGVNNVTLVPNQWAKISGFVSLEEDATYITLGQFANPDDPKDLTVGYFFVDDVRIEAILRDAQVYLPKIKIEGKESFTLENIYFATDKYDLLPRSFPELDKLVSILKTNSTANVEIHGHTDIIGDSEHNQTLSLNRAKSVKNYLVQKGIKSDRLNVIGHGAAKAIASNETEEGRQQNRRVELEMDKVKPVSNTIEGASSANEAYRFSIETKDQKDLQVINGRYRPGDYCNPNIPKPELNKQEASTFRMYKTSQAKRYILEKAKDSKYIIINTHKYAPETKIYLQELLPELKAQGFDKLLVGDLATDSKINELGYPVIEDGFLIREPVYGNLLRTAVANGFNVESYKASKGQLSKANSIVSRMKQAGSSKSELAQSALHWSHAMNANRIAKASGGSKIIILTNYDGVEEISTDGRKLASWFKEFSNSDPLTIDLTTMRDRCPEFENPIYRTTSQTNPQVFLRNNIAYVLKEFDAKNNEKIKPCDMQVFMPQNTEQQSRPKYLYRTGATAQKVLPSKYGVGFPSMIFAFPEGEDIDTAVPTDIIEMKTAASQMPLVLKPGKYTLLMKDGAVSKRLEVEF